MSGPRTFACPSCKEIINDGMRECRFCGAPVDPAIAASIADVQDKVNQACSDASYLRHAALIMFACLGLSFIPFIPVVGLAFYLVFFAVLFMLIRWHMKFSGLLTNDPDYAGARRAKNIALALWVLAIPLAFIVRPIVHYLVFGF
ncbi:MAG TPA: hypothetical protein VE360_11070 [Pyrinomonadaceae bacterium]|nr:hypothetical protein [Pyrinomonadaceae bacterium]